ncbi:MSHA pilin protein MshA [Vibrio crassostreae]|uniref:type II secretion system protein n=1 Tax=Vibrio crassostreae TaxID=246167 RepID=UPI0005E1B107|nr:type II secretion system protein [Vibrio crassostreae]TCT58199.1 MSHA pilin protein MshA [Vibrio crassostreae]TCT78990.1 MSHA pilin protein MshA [Vibrio crassostreae]TCU04224.1 MSHA pilin protein MshA [Vibrio crassostreae]TDW06591.1 MSHA pilin protein MshA [Vibrio crassostreae]CAK1762043.1 MSHA pilin protein MshA [Vibrio crassostreae]
MKRQGGFTLIELVVVIVILGILAVTAAPRFLNLQDDARESSLQGLKGAIDSAAGIVYGKAAVEGVESKVYTATPAPSVEGITTSFGYPTADEAGIGKAVVGLTTDWAVTASVANTSITYSFSGTAADATACIVTYTQATGTTAASAATTTVTLGTAADGCGGTGN